MIPAFPQFKPIQMEDRDFFRQVLWEYQPQTSEWTFTNLFLWRSYYGFHWSRHGDWLLIICTSSPCGFSAFQPVGPPSRLEVTRLLLEWLQEEKGVRNPCVDRADRRLVAEIEGEKGFLIEPLREQFDYIYRSDDLIQLGGRKYHAKRNHIHKFSHYAEFRTMPSEHISSLSMNDLFMINSA